MRNKVYKAHGERLLNYCALHDTVMKDTEVIKYKCDLRNCWFYFVLNEEEVKVLRDIYKRRKNLMTPC